MKYPVAVTVNGRLYRSEVEARTLLADFLREEVGCRSVRSACETGQCGACVVLLGGKTLKACTRLAVQVDGESLQTLEGLFTCEPPSPAAAFQDPKLLPCGYCTSGVCLALDEVLRLGPGAAEVEIPRALEGVLCRCTSLGGVAAKARELSGLRGGHATSREGPAT